MRERGHLFKIKARRIFKAQHMLICEHLNCYAPTVGPLENADTGEIDRLRMGTKLELISAPRIALTLVKVFLILFATVLVGCTKTTEYPAAPIDSISALESLAKAYEAESGNLPIAPTQMNAKAKKKFLIDVFRKANFSYQKTLQSFQLRDNKFISKNIKDLAELLSLPHNNISSQSKAELYTEQELKAIAQIDIIAH